MNDELSEQYKDDLELFRRLAAEKRRVWPGRDIFGKTQFYYAYLAGFGDANELFAKGKLHFFPFSEQEYKNESALQGIEKIISDYDIPIQIVIREDPAIKQSLLKQAVNEAGLLCGIFSIRDINDYLSAYITDVRGAVPKDSDVPQDKNPEDFYGEGNKNGIFMTLGGKKGLSTESIKKATMHEFIHMCGHGHHHDTVEHALRGRTRKLYFNPEEQCVLVSNNNLAQRSDKPCAVLDYELRFRVQGFKDRSVNLH